ncbi:hypothetical protein M3649_04010 [Ureibacillus chungkukjangi]|uniref:hypothetical protein n=1 Tax=Ureibacillus chungkukjangi TaxID=1202712 RepID=UPI00203D844F|nr:hypothetical protein [Ureibacillus chungkukjangi]MCM3387297.1 hypothetical protein [Ureibacillus chungkukjangi]
MKDKQGFYSVEPLNSEFTRIALVWNNVVWGRYGNATVSKEIIDVIKFPSEFAGVIGRLDIEEAAKELTSKNDVHEYAINYGY